MSCAIPLKVYKKSKALVSLEKREEGKNRGIQNRCIVEELKARNGGTHSQGKPLCNIYSIDMCYKDEC